jgi:hypothetical protein
MISRASKIPLWSYDILIKTLIALQSQLWVILLINKVSGASLIYVENLLSAYYSPKQLAISTTAWFGAAKRTPTSRKAGIEHHFSFDFWISYQTIGSVASG